MKQKIRWRLKHSFYTNSMYIVVGCVHVLYSQWSFGMSWAGGIVAMKQAQDKTTDIETDSKEHRIEENKQPKLKTYVGKSAAERTNEAIATK